MSWREEKKMPFIVATYVYACSPRAAHALRSDQLFGDFNKVNPNVIIIGLDLDGTTCFVSVTS